ncbi:Alpha-lactalbumin [Dissostichus eleginoides]|uniref:Alpha-lactalbumin n=1 Tax=Dissostichus eleginoides TaxID=100907 RepID=A0AAD9BPJ5_DISEL|nr:Alpha-lactalbumin [Dissostichus eleginoides]KAK1887084.1 Alpha-lactalbumin [Dissostichus eleginoides]
MKLLAVLLVAVVLPNLSEGREVSRCEMNKSLEGKIKLPTRLEKHREKILSILICKMEQRSGLKTDLVKVLGKRPTLIVKPTLIPLSLKSMRQNLLDLNPLHPSSMKEQR